MKKSFLFLFSFLLVSSVSLSVSTENAQAADFSTQNNKCNCILN
ncbi:MULTISPECIES: hypothetical protein [Bacillus]|nr:MULTISPECIES: hypothetical protein [Bacillus subtilis group]MEC0631976.1 hypothetical protein [Bacillus spizizenii]MEC1408870.1 hypothetical protein [Bacillus halotolerans]